MLDVPLPVLHALPSRFVLQQIHACGQVELRVDLLLCASFVGLDPVGLMLGVKV